MGFQIPYLFSYIKNYDFFFNRDFFFTIASKKFHDRDQLKFCGSNPRNMYFMPHHSAKVGSAQIFEIISLVLKLCTI